MAVKQCSKCGETKEEEDFRLRMKRGKQYLNASCKECERAYNLDYYHARPVEERNVPIWKRHRMTEEQYNQMMEKQMGLCANPQCSNEATVIDHDHTCCPGKRSCGKCVVGLLCQGCNKAEGLLGSNANKALGLAEYIIMTRKVKTDVDA